MFNSFEVVLSLIIYLMWEFVKKYIFLHAISCCDYVKFCEKLWWNSFCCCNEVTMLISWRQPEVFGLEFLCTRHRRGS